MSINDLENVSRFWNRHLKDSSSLAPGEEVFFSMLLNIALKCSNILEVGVGKGRMPKVLRANGVKAEIHGVDITDNVQRSGTIGVIGDARALPYQDNTFDLVYSLGTVEHFPETLQAINEHARVVKERGHVLVTTPHLSVFSPLRYFVWLVKDRRMGSFEEIRGRSMTLKVMKKYFKYAGLEIEAFGTFGLYAVWRIIEKLNLRVSLLDMAQRVTCIGSYLYVLGMKK